MSKRDAGDRFSPRSRIVEENNVTNVRNQEPTPPNNLTRAAYLPAHQGLPGPVAEMSASGRSVHNSFLLTTHVTTKDGAPSALSGCRCRTCSARSNETNFPSTTCVPTCSRSRPSDALRTCPITRPSKPAPAADDSLPCSSRRIHSGPEPRKGSRISIIMKVEKCSERVGRRGGGLGQERDNKRDNNELWCLFYNDDILGTCAGKPISYRYIRISAANRISALISDAVNSPRQPDEAPLRVAGREPNCHRRDGHGGQTLDSCLSNEMRAPTPGPRDAVAWWRGKRFASYP